MNVKQVIVIRKDIKMPPGKLAAQVAHASMAAILHSGEVIEKNDKNGDLAVREFRLELFHRPTLDQWLFKGAFTKVCLRIDSEEELQKLYDETKSEGIPCSLIIDNGMTVFKEPTMTCAAFGPCVSEWLDKRTGHLKLY